MDDDKMVRNEENLLAKSEDGVKDGENLYRIKVEEME